MQFPLCPTSTGFLDLTGCLLPELTHDSQAPVWICFLCSSLPVCCHRVGSILSPRFFGIEAHVLLCVSLASLRRLHNVCCCYACSPFCSLNNWAEKPIFYYGKTLNMDKVERLMQHLFPAIIKMYYIHF